MADERTLTEKLEALCAENALAIVGTRTSLQLHAQKAIREALDRLAQLEAFRAEVEGLADSLGQRAQPATDHAKGYYQARYEAAEELRAALKRVGKVGGEGGQRPAEEKTWRCPQCGWPIKQAYNGVFLPCETCIFGRAIERLRTPDPEPSEDNPDA